MKALSVRIRVIDAAAAAVAVSTLRHLSKVAMRVALVLVAWVAVQGWWRAVAASDSGWLVSVQLI